MAKITKKQKALAGKVDSNKLYPLVDEGWICFKIAP